MSPSGNVTSLSLIERAKSRDPDAWRQMCQIYAPLIYSWTRKAGVVEHDAADIVQEVFRIVSTRLDRFRHNQPGDTFRGWLLTITHNEVCGFMRRQSKQSPPAIGGSTAQHQIQQLPDGLGADASSESWVGSKTDRREVIRRAVMIVRNDFDSHTWQAFWRSVVENHVPEEIAADLKMTPNAIRQARFRILNRLRETLGNELN